MENKELENKIYDELFIQYETDHSLRSIAYIHPMFYNGTVSKTNEIQPEEPEPLLTKEEFINNLNTPSPMKDTKWSFAAQVLASYLLRNERNQTS